VCWYTPPPSSSPIATNAIENIAIAAAEISTIGSFFGKCGVDDATACEMIRASGGTASMAGNDFNTTQPIKSMPFDFKLKAGEILRVRCDNHTWMAAYVGIFDHPYFSVSGTDGAFTIANVPAGKQTVKAWHEVMGTQTQMVDVQAGKTTTVDFTFMPAQKAAAVTPVRDIVIPETLTVASIITR